VPTALKLDKSAWSNCNFRRTKVGFVNRPFKLIGDLLLIAGDLVRRWAMAVGSGQSVEPAHGCYRRRSIVQKILLMT
jgi:hypothetical protein